MLGSRKVLTMPDAAEALPGRTEAMPVPARHFVLSTPLVAPFPAGCGIAYFGLGCFWGAEKLFWQIKGVHTTAVGYAGGMTPNPTYQEVCTGRTGHNEVVMVVFAEQVVDYAALLRVFWEAHDPTQGMRQGNDVGTQYRSGIYYTTVLHETLAKQAQRHYQSALAAAGYGSITTEIIAAPKFFYAEDYHQQYLAKNPHGYCGIGGTGVSCQMQSISA